MMANVLNNTQDLNFEQWVIYAEIFSSPKNQMTSHHMMRKCFGERASSVMGGL